MKKLVQLILFGFAFSLCVCTVEAATPLSDNISLQRASDYFDTYTIDTTSGAKGEIVVNFRIYATGFMSSIGVKKIIIQEKTERVGKKFIQSKAPPIMACWIKVQTNSAVTIHIMVNQEKHIVRL